MIEILRDPLWQFVGAFVAIAAIGTSLWFYWAQKQRKAIECLIISQAAVVSVSDDFEGKIQILYEGIPIQDAHLIILSIRNSGNVPILPGDFHRALEFGFGDVAKVMSAGIIEERPVGIEATARIEDNRVILGPLLLNSDDSILLKVLVDNAGEIAADGRFVGIEPPKIREQTVVQRAIEQRNSRLRLALVATAAVSVSFLAWQANTIARNSSSSTLDVIANSEIGNIIVVGCNTQSAEPYRLEREKLEIFTVRNSGASPVSLLRVRFFEGGREYPIVNIRMLEQERYFAEGEILGLPLDVEAGTARAWVAQAIDLSNWKTIPDALGDINRPDPSSLTPPETRKPTKWIFEFSDGTVIDNTYTDGWYHIQPNIDRWLQQSACN